MKLTVTKIFTFCCAHNLTDHNGLCNFIHGHNYKLEVKVENLSNDINLNEDPSQRGMVIDFSDLSNIINRKVIDKFDHSFVLHKSEKNWVYRIMKDHYNIHYNIIDNNDEDFEKLLEQNRILLVDWRPTAENMLQVFHGMIWKALNINTPKNLSSIRIVKLKLWETDSSFAELEEMDDR